MPEIRITIAGSLRRFLSPPETGPSSGRLRLPDGATIADVARAAGLPANLRMIFLHNGKPAKGETQVAQGDTVEFLPGLSGG